MPLENLIPELTVVDPSSNEEIHLEPINDSIEVEEPSDEIEVHVEEAPESLRVHVDRGAVDFDIPIFKGDLPGAAHSPEPVIEIEDDAEEDESKLDDNDLKKGKKKDPKWDWESRGATGFVTWITERFEDVPKHNGKDTAGLERAVAYLDKLDSEISKAMRLDLNGDLDAEKVAAIRDRIEEGMEKLEDRLSKVNKGKKNKKKADSESEGLIKEAQKITGVKGIMITVPLFISRLARICINGSVSAGHDINHTYSELSDKYKLTSREKAELIQLLEDFGYPIREDRGTFDGKTDTSSSDNFDWAANYTG